MMAATNDIGDEEAYVENDEPEVIPDDGGGHIREPVTIQGKPIILLFIDGLLADILLTF